MIATETTKQTCWAKVCNKLNFIKSYKCTVEPIVFCYVAAWTMQSLLTTYLLIDKVCNITLKEDENCTNHPTYKSKEDDIHLYVSQLNMTSKLIQNIPTIFFVLLLGSWSDKNGRKIPMLLPFFGCLLSSFICMMNSYFWRLPPEHILIASIPRAITGGFITLMMATHSYISDISNENNRTTKMAILDVMFVVSPVVGVYSSNLLLNIIGYSGSFGICGLVYLICILYIVFWIKDSRGPLTDDSTEKEGDPEKIVVEANYFKQAMKTIFCKRENRSRILILMFVTCFMSMIYGSVSLDLLYLQKKFSWSYASYTSFITFQLGLSGLGSSVLLPLMSSKFNLGDLTLGFIGSISKMSESLFIGLGINDLYLYSGAFIGCLGKIPFSVSRAAISKMVSQDEIGRIFSLMASFESLIPLVSNPLYTFLYNATIETFTGAIFVMSAVIYTISAAIFLYLMLKR